MRNLLFIAFPVTQSRKHLPSGYCVWLPAVALTLRSGLASAHPKRAFLWNLQLGVVGRAEEKKSAGFPAFFPIPFGTQISVLFKSALPGKVFPQGISCTRSPLHPIGTRA